MSKTIRLTAAQALVRYVMAQKNDSGERFIAGTWAIFGHGNVTGMGEALAASREIFPVWRGHNEQSMAHAAIAYAKAKNCRQAMAVTSSIGPGATNMVTAAATAHANRLPLLLIPGDVFADRAPDPVLQQIEDFSDGTVSANDCFRAVSRYFDRITRPEQILTALPRAFAAMTDPAQCGPVTLAFCQDVQAQAFDYPVRFFAENVRARRRIRPDEQELAKAVDALRGAKKPLIIAGGGVLYSQAQDALAEFAQKRQIPVAETQAGKSSLPWDCEMNFGAIGVTGSQCANQIASQADVILAVGTRLQDFTTGSWKLFRNPDHKIIALNAAMVDVHKGGLPLMADAREGLEALSESLGEHRFESPPLEARRKWLDSVEEATKAPENNALPGDAQVIGAVQRAAGDDCVLLGAAGGLPGELHKLWKAKKPNSYHMEYGYSCMGYEIAAGLGAKMALPEREIIVMIGDGSYMMMNSELATSVMLGRKITVVLLDNRGFGCINRLQLSAGQESFNNLLDSALIENPSSIDFVAHAESMGAIAHKADSLEELESALKRARQADRSSVIVIDTDPMPSTQAGGAWWNVAIAEVSERSQVRKARAEYEKNLDDAEKS